MNCFLNSDNLDLGNLNEDEKEAGDEDEEEFDAKELEHLEGDSFDEDFGSGTDGEEEGSQENDSNGSEGKKTKSKVAGKLSANNKGAKSKEKINFRRTKKSKLVIQKMFLYTRKAHLISRERSQNSRNTGMLTHSLLSSPRNKKWVTRVRPHPNRDSSMRFSARRNCSEMQCSKST